MREKKTLELAEILASVLDPVAVNHRSAFRRLSLAWPTACGPTVARHAEPLGLRDALLVVGVRGRHWREAVFQDRMMLTDRLRRYWKPLRGIRLESLPLKPPVESAADTYLVVADPRTADIHDADLRAALDGLLSARSRRG